MSRWWWLAALLLAVGCGGGQIALTDHPPVDYQTMPWCADSSGHSPRYPCKWDKRERTPSPAWDPQATAIAIFTPRDVGCGGLLRDLRTPDTTPLASWSCYYAPEETPWPSTN